MAAEHPHAIVLGAGIQGVCTALALARRAHRVMVVDAADDCMQRTSVQNEGKIHLGFVYANDPSARTPELMLEAALAFGDLVEGLVDHPVDWTSMRSRPFTYLVLDESIVAPPALFEAYARLQQGFDARRPARYVGTTPERLWSEVDVAALRPTIASDRIQAAVRTVEVALDRQLLRHDLRDALHTHPSITACYGHTVREAARTNHGFEVSGTRADGERWTAHAPVMVNCLWDHRIALDAQLGIHTARDVLYRLKYRVLGHLDGEPADLPSLTMVLGKFGDLVMHPGHPVYLSWYPTCLAGWATSPTPPPHWAAACGRDDLRAETRALGRATVAAMAEIVPALARLRIARVDAGVIVARGTTDIDDRASELHARHEIGVHAYDGWFSIHTGKFTTAPRFADQLATLVGPPA